VELKLTYNSKTDYLFFSKLNVSHNKEVFV
jgi:hypothetical protein